MSDSRSKLMEQTQCPCGGLKDLPHLHTEGCEARKKEVVLFRENADERRSFDQFTDIFDGHPLRQVASTLDTWGRARQGGSFADACFIMANECLIADAAEPPSRNTVDAEIIERIENAVSEAQAGGRYDGQRDDGEFCQVRTSDLQALLAVVQKGSTK